MRGCGISSSADFTCAFPYSRMSRSISRGPLGIRFLRPISRSIRWIFWNSWRGNRSVSISTTWFRNHGWSGTSRGSVSHTEDVRVTRTRSSASRVMASARFARRSPRFDPSPKYAIFMLEERVLSAAATPGNLEGIESPFGGHAAPRRPVQKPQLDQVGFVDLFDGVRLLVDG